jgi:hypothetical protein|tara:strand:- start:388 stop:561 length:174 start_codon:yes stop_codon:yes gene_type:complete
MKINDEGIWEQLLYLMLMDMTASQTFIKAENHVKVEVDEKRIDKGYEQGKEVVRKYD